MFVSFRSPLFHLGVAAVGGLLILAPAGAQQPLTLRPAQKTLKQPASQLRPSGNAAAFPNMAADGLLAPFSANGGGAVNRGNQNSGGTVNGGVSAGPLSGVPLPSLNGRGQPIYSPSAMGGFGNFGAFGPYGMGGYPYGGAFPYAGGFGFGGYPYGGFGFGGAFPYGGAYPLGGFPYAGTPGYAGVGLMPLGPTPFGMPQMGMPFGGAYPLNPAMPFGQVPYPQAGNPSVGAPIIGF